MQQSEYLKKCMDAQRAWHTYNELMQKIKGQSKEENFAERLAALTFSTNELNDLFRKLR